MTELIKTDLQFCVSRIPKDIRDLMQKYSLILGGGFIRNTISGEKVNDIDLFGADATTLQLAAQELGILRTAKIHETKYAYTILSPPRLPVQLIKRWHYTEMITLCQEFDFTVCQAAIRFLSGESGGWTSWTGERFYPDLAAKRLVYTSPQRDEEAGGSFLRMRKFLQRGYSIQAVSMAAVTARLIAKIPYRDLKDENVITRVITNLLREVDPMAVIDGIDFLDEHEIISQESGDQEHQNGQMPEAR